MQLEQPVSHGGHNRNRWEQEIHEIYTDAADGVIALQDKLGWYEQNRLPIYEAKWPTICSILQEVPASEQLEAYLTSVGLDIHIFETTYGQQKIQNAIWYAKDLKDRYSVLWMYYDLMK